MSSNALKRNGRTFGSIVRGRSFAILIESFFLVSSGTDHYCREAPLPATGSEAEAARPRLSSVCDGVLLRLRGAPSICAHNNVCPLSAGVVRVMSHSLDVPGEGFAQHEVVDHLAPAAAELDHDYGECDEHEGY